MYCEKYISTAILLWLVAGCCIAQNAKQDLHDCGVDHSDATYASFIDDLPAIRTFLNTEYASRNGDTTYVPVYFHVFRETDGSFTGTVEINQTIVDSSLVMLNEYFAPGNYIFFQLGDINYIDNSQFSTYYQSFSNHLSYVSSALNVYTSASIYRSQAESPNHCYNTPGVDDASDFFSPAPVECMNNNVFLKSTSYLNTTFTHEVGHTYGLMHTFSGAAVYNNPSNPTQGYTGGYDDHPYDGTYSRRELVLQETDDSKAFPMPNKLEAGDMVGDTPAFCMSTVSYFPSIEEEDCTTYPFPTTCKSCKVLVVSENECVYEGSYRDYNGDQLLNPEVGVRNFMSYTGRCRTEFTPGQYERMAFYNTTVRSEQYDANAIININEEVQYMATDRPVSGVSIQFQHPSTYQISRSFTTSEGEFQGILYADSLEVHLRKYGSLPPTSSILPVSMSYTADDWLKGIDMMDVMAIARHDMGIQALNGYQQLAADVNNDGQVDNLDVQALYLLIIGFAESLDAFETPWRFVPEYIPHDYPVDFHKNPFGMTIAGDEYNYSAPYLEDEWSYTLSETHDTLGLRGFDAIKIGDINGTWAAQSDAMALNTHPSTGNPAIELDDIYQLVDDMEAFEKLLAQNNEAATEKTALHTQTNESLKVIVFPNPALTENVTLQYTIDEEQEATIIIRDMLGRQLNKSAVVLMPGTNQLPVKVSSYAGQVITLSLKTETKEFIERVVCL